MPENYNKTETIKMTHAEEITHKTALQTFHAAYVRRVGVGPGRLSYSALEAETDIPLRTLKSWTEGAAMPHLDNLLKLCAVFGPDFASELLHLAGLGGVEHVAPVTSDAHACLADLAEPLSVISDRLRDGVFCHVDKAVVGPRLVNLAHKLEEQGQAMINEALAGPHAA